MNYELMQQLHDHGFWYRHTNDCPFQNQGDCNCITLLDLIIIFTRVRGYPILPWKIWPVSGWTYKKTAWHKEIKKSF